MLWLMISQEGNLGWEATRIAAEGLWRDSSSYWSMSANVHTLCHIRMI